jgi:hypothetical protein
MKGRLMEKDLKIKELEEETESLKKELAKCYLNLEILEEHLKLCNSEVMRLRYPTKYKK